jgi:hypothetical protein
MDPQHLRFTRSGQALHFITLGILFACAAVALFALGTKWIDIEAYIPPLPTPWWGLLPLLPALASFWIAASNLRHPYLVFGPVGIEIYPLFFPSKNMNLIPWSQIARLEIDERLAWLTISYPENLGGGCVLSLNPISPKNRQLLAHAIDGIRKSHLAEQNAG